MANIHLKSLLSVVQKRFLSSTSLSTSTFQSSLTVHYLVNSCGLSPQSALSTSHKLKLHERNLQRLESVLSFLKYNAFDDTQITKLIEKFPRILQFGVENNLKPKIEYLTQNGFTGTLLTEFILSHPHIFVRSLEDRIEPSFNFLINLLGSSDKVLVAIKRASWLLDNDLEKTLKRNTNFLINEKVPVSSVSKLVLLNPRAMLTGFDTLIYKFNVLKELGLEPQFPMFIRALSVMIQLSETTFKKKMEVFESLGWTAEEILSMFKGTPYCLALSEETIKSKMDFFLNTIKLERELIIARPIFLHFSMDTIHRRYNILKVLESKKLLKWDKKIAHSLVLAVRKFFDNYIDKYKNSVPGLLEMYKDTTKLKK